MTHAQILAIADPMVKHARECVTCYTAPNDARLCSRGQELKTLALALIDTPEPAAPNERCGCPLCTRCPAKPSGRNLYCACCLDFCR